MNTQTLNNTMLFKIIEFCDCMSTIKIIKIHNPSHKKNCSIEWLHIPTNKIYLSISKKYSFEFLKESIMDKYFQVIEK